MTQVFNGLAVEYTGSILLGTPPSQINPGIGDNNQVAVVQLNNLKANLQGLISDAEATQRAGDEALNAQLQQAITQIDQRLTAAVEGVRDRIVVGARTDSLADVSPTTPGVDPTSTNGYSNLILVLDPANPATNGVYLPNGTRDPRFPATTSFQNGQLIFVDSDNSHWYVSDTPTATNLPLQPFGRVQDLGVDPATFLTIAANRITAHVNPEFFRILPIGGVNTLDFSQALIDWRNGVNQDLGTLRSDVTNIQQLNETQSAQIASIQAKDQAQDTGIASLTSAVAVIQATDQTQDTAIAAIQAKDQDQDTVIAAIQTKDQQQDSAISAIQAKDQQQDTAITAIQAKDQAQDATIAEIQQLDQNQDAAIRAIQTKDQQQDTAIAAIQATDLAQDTEIGTLQTDLAAVQQVDQQQNAAISAEQRKNTQQDTLLDGLRTDVTAIQTLDQQQAADIQAVQLKNTQQDSAISAIQAVDQTQDAAISTLQTNLAAVQAVDQQQNTTLTAIQAKDTQQDGLISSLQTEVGTKTTISDAEALFMSLVRRYNPILPLNGRVIDQISVTGTDPLTGAAVTYNVIITTFTLELGEADFRVTELSETLAPFQSVKKPEISYPGTQCILRFYTREPGDPANPQPGEGPVPDNEFEAWFHKGFR